jgi:hypothetical protein
MVFSDKRFIVTTNEYESNFDHLILLSDIAYWNSRYEDLVAWCRDNRSEVLGMTVNIPDDDTLTLFILQWA